MFKAIILSLVTICVITNLNGQLTFLSEPLRETPLDFATGFLDGISVFSNLPHEDECVVVDPQVVSDFEKVAELLKDLNVRNAVQKIAQVIPLVMDAYTRIGQTTAECQLWADEVNTILEQLKTYFAAEGYTTKVALHALSHVIDVKNKITDAQAHLAAEELRAAGSALGDLTRFVAFWDFTPQ